MQIPNKLLLKLVLIGITFFLIFNGVNKQIGANPLNDDGLANLRLAYSIAHFGTMADFSGTDSAKIYPSNAREPVPNWLTAQWIRFNKPLFDDQTLHLKQSPDQLIKLKQVNTCVLMGVFIGIFCLAYTLFQPALSPLITFILAYVTLLLSYACMHTIFVTTMITEFHGALFIVWFCWAWLKLFQTQRWLYAVIAGSLLGLLILTKAAFLYISLVLMCVLILWLLFVRRNHLQVLKHFLLVLTACVVVLPWMYRNYVNLGTFEIAGRSTNVLMTRVFKSQMTDEEFKGAFYAYAPASLKKTMKKITGFSSQDRELGGRLQRFTRFFPEDEKCLERNAEHCAIGYYIQASIRYNIIMQTYRHIYPNDAKKATLEGEKAAKNYAINLIKSNPWGHLRTTLVFAWRGAWPCNKVDGRWYKHEKVFLQPAWQEIMPFLGLVAMFGLAMTALIKKQDELIALSWLGCATFLFYSSATHFIPRYSEMMIPIWVICFVYGLVALVHKMLASSRLFNPSTLAKT